MKRKMLLGMLLLLAVLLVFTTIPLGVLAETALNSETQTTDGAVDQVPVAEAEKIADPSVSAVQTCVYQTHVQNQGWQDWRADGAMSGTEGLSYRLDGLGPKWRKLGDGGFRLSVGGNPHCDPAERVSSTGFHGQSFC